MSKQIHLQINTLQNKSKTMNTSKIMDKALSLTNL